MSKLNLTPDQQTFPKREATSNRDSSDGLLIVFRPISEIKLDPRNPRSHSKAQIRQIARSINAFGFNVPILIDKNLNVIAGHGRLLAAQLLGLTEVPTIKLEHLTQAQARALMIADNRLTENAVWDDRLLAEQLKELSVLDLDFDLEATGFEMGEIDLDSRLHPKIPTLPTRCLPMIRGRLSAARAIYGSSIAIEFTAAARSRSRPMSRR